MKHYQIWVNSSGSNYGEFAQGVGGNMTNGTDAFRAYSVSYESTPTVGGGVGWTWDGITIQQFTNVSHPNPNKTYHQGGRPYINAANLVLNLPTVYVQINLNSNYYIKTFIVSHFSSPAGGGASNATAGGSAYLGNITIKGSTDNITFVDLGYADCRNAGYCFINNILSGVSSTPPSSLIFSAPTPPNLNHNSSNITINVTFSEADGNTVQAQFLINGTPHLNISTTKLYANYTTNFSRDGDYNYTVRVCDADGCASEVQRIFTLDTLQPIINILIPGANPHYVNYSNFKINITINDTNLDRTNLTGYNQSSNAIKFTNFTNLSNKNLSFYLQEDTLNLSLLGEGNYTFEICAGDSAQDSPEKEFEIIKEIPKFEDGVEKQKELKIADEATGNDLSVFFEMYDKSGTRIPFTDRDIEFSYKFDGKHILFGGSAKFSQGDYGVFRYHSNNPDIYFIEKHRRNGHFVTSDYKLFVDHNSLVEKGWSIFSQVIDTNGDFVVYFSRDGEGLFDFDPLVGALNQRCTNFTMVYDATLPNIGLLSTSSTNGSFTQTYIPINITFTDRNPANATIFLFYTNGTFVTSQTTSTSPFFYNFTNLGVGNYKINSSALDLAQNTISYDNQIFVNLTSALPSYSGISVSPASGTVYETRFIYQFNITWSNLINYGILSLNNVNYSIIGNSTLLSYNFSLLPGIYPFYFWANNSAGSNMTSLSNYTVLASQSGASGAPIGGSPNAPLLIEDSLNNTDISIMPESHQLSPFETLIGTLSIGALILFSLFGLLFFIIYISKK